MTAPKAMTDMASAVEDAAIAMAREDPIMMSTLQEHEACDLARAALIAFLSRPPTEAAIEKAAKVMCCRVGCEARDGSRDDLRGRVPVCHATSYIDDVRAALTAAWGEMRRTLKEGAQNEKR